jgi:hypothetical protein
MGKRNKSTGGRQRHQKQRDDAHKKHVANKRVDKSSSDEEVRDLDFFYLKSGFF